MTTASKTTTDHDQIWRWTGAWHRTPAAVRATDSGDDPGAQPVRVRDESADQLEAIDWNDCFAKFAESRLAFLYQDKTADRGTSRFRRFVKPS